MMFCRVKLLRLTLLVLLLAGTATNAQARFKKTVPDIDVPPREFVLAENLVRGKGQIHASTLEALKDGTVVCAAFMGRKEGHKDVNIVISRRSSEGWSRPETVTEKGRAHWNPVLFEVRPDDLFLMYKVGKSPINWVTMVRESTDHGLTWSEERPLVPSDKRVGRGPVKNKPIRLESGRILAPGSMERVNWQAFVDITDDEGLTWHQSNIIRANNIPPGQEFGRGVIQPTLWQDDIRGDVHMLLRSTEGLIYKSDSQDEGKTWCPAYPLSVPNNNSGLDVVKNSQDGLLYLVCNPTTDISIGTRRTPLSLLFSRDNGKTWSKMLDLETGRGEFSYPAVVEENGNLYISYTWKRLNIAYRHFTPRQLTKYRLLSQGTY